ncbi:MAG: hypothetical protein R6U86_06545 [Bacteroidales bacterium]
MASKKELKKDINYLIDEVIGTCLLHQYTQGKEKQEELDGMITEMIEYRDQLIHKANHPEVKDGKLKAYYRSLYDELLEKVNGAFEKLGSSTE